MLTSSKSEIRDFATWRLWARLSGESLGQSRKAAKQQRRPLRTRLSLEALEDRFLPSIANASFVFPSIVPQGVAFNNVPVVQFQSTALSGQITDTIFWGDGSISHGVVVPISVPLPPAPSTFLLTAGHTFAEDGKYPVTVLLTDPNGSVEVEGNIAWNNTVAPLPYPIYNSAAASANGRIYDFGGQISPGPDGAVAKYAYLDPATNVWTEFVNMPTPRTQPAAVTGHNGRIYVIGGANSISAALTTLEILDPATNTWTTGAAMPTGRSALAAAVGLDDRIYVFGGKNFAGISLNTVEAY